MDITEEMLRGIAIDLLGNAEVASQGETYDFGKPFTRMTVKESILHFNPDIPAATWKTGKERLRMPSAWAST